MKLYWRAALVTVPSVSAVGVAAAQQQLAPFPSWDDSAGVAPVSSRVEHIITVGDSIRVVAGYQHWRGAGIGAGMGGALGALAAVLGTIASRCVDCGQEPSVGEMALMTGLLGAGAGSVMGFLVGLASPKYVWTQAAEAPR